MQTAFLIPARYGSSRLPGKPLIHIAGAEAICYPFQACGRVAGENDLVRVVTDDGRIATAVGPQNAIFVTKEVANGTERCVLALDQIPDEYEQICIIAGDETCVTPANIKALVEASRPDEVWTAVCRNPGAAVTTVKVDEGRVTEFSRSNELPFAALGMYVYHRRILRRYYYQWPMTACERNYGIELLRPFIEGIPVHAVEVDHPGYGLNTAADADLIEAWLNER